MAIRNLVARTRYHSKAFIENGAEQLISKARLQHKKGKLLVFFDFDIPRVLLWLPSSSSELRYGTNGNPGLRRQPN